MFFVELGVLTWLGTHIRIIIAEPITIPSGIVGEHAEEAALECGWRIELQEREIEEGIRARRRQRRGRGRMYFVPNFSTC